MNVLVLGGTGSIGDAVVAALLERGHEVVALGRSDKARLLLQEAGATPIEGGLRDPSKWIDVVDDVDGIIHAAAVWDQSMAEVDRRFIETLLASLQHDQSSKALIYTGGCWMFGETGDVIATEESPLNSIADFAWSIPLMQMVLSAACIRGMVIHPAMVYERNGGVFAHIFEDAKRLGYVRVIGREDIRWPMVHRDDLADLYVLMLEQGKQGDVFNGAAVHGIPIGAMTRAIAQRLNIQSEPVLRDVASAMNEMGAWAKGYALDQQLSGQKAIEQLGWHPKHIDVIADIA